MSIALVRICERLNLAGHDDMNAYITENLFLRAGLCLPGLCLPGRKIDLSG
jgi:hypothetical protein